MRHDGMKVESEELRWIAKREKDAVIGLCGALARRVGGRYTWVKGWSKFGMLNNVSLLPIASLPLLTVMLLSLVD